MKLCSGSAETWHGEQPGRTKKENERKMNKISGHVSSSQINKIVDNTSSRMITKLQQPSCAPAL